MTTAPPATRRGTYRGHPALLCEDCRRPFVYARGDVYVIEVRHSGEVHRCLVTLADLLALRDNAAADRVE